MEALGTLKGAPIWALEGCSNLGPLWVPVHDVNIFSPVCVYGRYATYSFRVRAHSSPNLEAPRSHAAAKGSAGVPKSAKVTPSQWPSNWTRQIGGVGVCISFHTAKCRNNKCRFSHKCPILTVDGTLCGADRSALAHSSAPH